MKEAVKAFEPNKAAGPDGLQPCIIQNTWDHISGVIQNIMITSHKLQHVPTPWNESKGIFLAKPGKTDYQQAKSFRTITLSATMLKLQERLILWHMQHDLKMDDQTNDQQYGFRKGRSTEGALHKIIYKIEKRIAKKGYVIGTFLDIEGAFDNVSHKAIAEAVYATPVDKSTAGWIINMVTNRQLTITHKTATKRFRVRRGCPQGGILSPFLWNLVVDDLLRYTAKEIPGYLQAFADDLVVLCESNDLEVARSRTITTIKSIERWCQSKGLKISALKTKIINFTWKTKWTLKPIKVGGEIIPLAKSVKFLGVHLDPKLNFNEHISKIAANATASLMAMQCKRAVGPTWGLNPQTCKWLYLTTIRPILSYCSTVWIRALTTENNRKVIRKVQSLALRILSGAMPGTPNEALDHIIGIPGIINYLNGEAAKGATRLQSQNTWTKEVVNATEGTILSHATMNNEYIKNLGLPQAAKDLIKPKLIIKRAYTTKYPTKQEADQYKSDLPDMINSLPIETITCYTDGSKTDEEDTGYGYFITTENNNTVLAEHSARLPSFCTVYQAELSAITAAVNQLQSIGVKDKEIIILSDSRSAIQTLNNRLIKSNTALQCHRALNALGLNNTVKVMWVEAHCGIYGNEKADGLAKEGTKHNTYATGYIPQSYIKQHINKTVVEMSEHEWSMTNFRHTNLTLGPNTKTTRKDLQGLEKNRNKFRIAIQLITGHIGLNDHLHKMTLVDSKTCPYCELEDETTGHYLGTCPSFAMIRGEIFNTYYASLSDIFENHRITEIVRYAIKTERFLEYKGPDPGGG